MVKKKEICNLCHQSRVLSESHIFPKFVYRWMKNTGTGALRFSGNLNRRIQDGLKSKFLCLDCEERFSVCERYFSSQIFYPAVGSSTSEFRYTEKLYYFAISIGWRLLKYGILDKEPLSYHNDKLGILENQWRNFLLSNQPIGEYNAIHLLITVDPLRDMDIDQHGIEVPKRFVQYMARTTDGDVMEHENFCVLFVKLPRFIFLFPVIGFDEKDFVRTAIFQNGGVYQMDRAMVNDSIIGDFFLDRVKILNGMFEEISPIQREQMRNAFLDKKKLLENSDLAKILNYSDRRYRG